MGFFVFRIIFIMSQQAVQGRPTGLNGNATTENDPVDAPM